MMEFKDEEAKAAWEKSVSVNTGEPYGEAVNMYAKDWAEMMEREMAKGNVLEQIADNCSHVVDESYGITGFQYGCVVSLLSQVWKHGESLRRWHNLETQLHDEGEKANAKPGSVLNPALMTFTTLGE